MGLKIEDFIKLSNEQKKVMYSELSENDKFLWRTQYEPISVTVIESNVEKQTEKERKKSREEFEKILKKVGILKENERLS